MASLRDVMSRIRPHLLTLDSYVAVDPPELLAQRAGIATSDIIKLNGNENPYGPSDRVRQALASLDRMHIYPDPHQVVLRKAIGNYVGLDPGCVVAGNGSDELIDLLLVMLVAPGDAIINCTPTFDMYRFATQIRGGTVLNLPRDSKFGLDLLAIRKSAHLAKAVFLTSPNNPTGNATRIEDVRQLLDIGIVVIVDEAYQEFGGESAIDLLSKYSNLIVLRTFSKWAGLAGLRVGYGLMAPELAQLLLQTKPPYSVNQAAEAAVMASLSDRDFLLRRVRQLVEERDRMNNLLRNIPGLTPWPSDANFILCETPPDNGRVIYEALASRGIFVRYFGNPRLQDFIRISVGKAEHTDKLIQALKEVVRG